MQVQYPRISHNHFRPLYIIHWHLVIVHSTIQYDKNKTRNKEEMRVYSIYFHALLIAMSYVSVKVHTAQQKSSD